MALQIDNTSMKGERTRRIAHQVDNGTGWVVSWLPGRVMDRNRAVTAMQIAEMVAGTDLSTTTDDWWLLIDSLAAELGLSGVDAVVKAA